MPTEQSSRPPDPDRYHAEWLDLDRALSGLGEAKLSIYVAYVCHPPRVSGVTHALQWMRERGLWLIYGNNPRRLEEFIDQRRREVQQALRDLDLWNERAA